MSFLSSLKSTVMKVGAIVTKPAPVIATAITSPIAFIKNPKEAVNKFVSQPLATQVVKGAIAGATLGTIAGGKAITVVKAAISSLPKSLGGKVVTLAAAPVVYGAVTSNPLGAIKRTTQAGEAFVDLGTTVANPTLPNIKEYVEEHPYATAALAAAATAATAKLILSTILATRQTEAIQEQTEAIQEQTKARERYNKAAANPTSVQPQQIIIQNLPPIPTAGVVYSPAAIPLVEEKKPIVEPAKKKSKVKKKATKKKSKKKATKKKAKKKATKKKAKKKSKKKTIKRRKSKR